MTSVTIVIPVLNSRERIGETLESIRSQTFPLNQLEIIIVDDGSSDDSVAVARTFMQRHDLRGTVLVADPNYGVVASRNRGWQAAAGDWIQFLDGDDLLAPNKIEEQMRQVSQLPDVICSSWQHLGLSGDTWQPLGPVTSPRLVDPILLKLVSPHAGLLGPALIRRKSLEAVGGFSEGVVYPDGEHLMLKIAGMGGRFVEAPSQSPLFFIRQTDTKARSALADLARQHLQNVVIAEAMLRQMKFGTLSRPDIKEIAGLCDWGLSVLYEHDWAAFQQYWQWLREIDPKFIPRHSMKLKFATAVLGYESAEGLALAYRWIKSSPRRMIGLISRAVFWSKSYASRELTKAMPSALSRVAGSARTAISDAPFAFTKGRFGFVGAAALLVAIGVAALAGLAALDWLESPPTPKFAEAPRTTPRLARTEAPWPSRTDNLKRAGKDQPESEVRTGSVAPAAPPTPATAKPGSIEVATAPLVPAENRSALIAAAQPQPPPASASPVPAEVPAPVPGTTTDRRDTGAQIVPAEPKTASIVAPEPPPTKLIPVLAEVPLPVPATTAIRGGASTPIVSAEPKTASIVALAPPRTDLIPVPTDVPVPVPAAAADRGDASAPIVPAGPRAASIVAPEPPPTNLMPVPAQLPAPVPAPTADRSDASARITPAEATRAPVVAPEPPRIRVSAIPTEVPTPAPGVAPSTKVEPASDTPMLSPEEQARAEKLVARGERDLADGNIASARQFFLRATTAGLARGAFLLAATYDPRELARLGVLGVQPDLAVARKWYERARELGAREADERLARLAAG